MNIVVPLAGKDPRFPGIPKPLIDLWGKPLIFRVLERHRITREDNLIFIVLQEYEDKFFMSKRLRNIFGSHITIRLVPHLAQGSPCSILDGAKDLIDTASDLLIELGDVLRDMTRLYSDIEKFRDQVAGIIPIDHKVLQGRPWGYVVSDAEGNAKELCEKEEVPSSDLATMGLYYFSHGQDFVRATETMIVKKSFLYKNLFFVGPVYNEMIKSGLRVVVSENKIEDVLGTPEEIREYGVA
jgi:dTDP-glucose pyrophosphorylase